MWFTTVYVSDDPFFRIFVPDIVDFDSSWRPHCTSTGHYLLVVVSISVDKQLYQAIWPLHYWFRCSDGPKLRYLVENVVFPILVHFRAWFLCATFWILTFNLPYATFPIMELTFPGGWPQWLPRGSNLRVAKLGLQNRKIKKTLKLGHVIYPWPHGLGSNFGWFLETSKPCQLTFPIKFELTLHLLGENRACKCNILAKYR